MKQQLADFFRYAAGQFGNDFRDGRRFTTLRADYRSTTANFPKPRDWLFSPVQRMRKPWNLLIGVKNSILAGERERPNGKTIKRQKPITTLHIYTAERENAIPRVSRLPLHAGGGKIFYKVVMETRNSFSCPR